MSASRRQSMGFVLRQFANSIIPLAGVHKPRMVMPTTQLNIVLSEQRAVAGEYLQAKVLLDSADPDTVIHSLIAEIKGVGRTGWVNIHTDKIFETEKVYLNINLSLCHDGVPIPVGKHQFPLQIQLPDHLPSSYESQFGTVRYQVKVTLTANSEQACCSEVFPLVVLARSFFDDIPFNVLSPIDFKDEVDFTCCSLPFGCVSIVISLPRTAFLLGENMEAQVAINNRTRKCLKECSLTLTMKTQFEAMSRYEHVNEKKLSEQLLEMVPLGSVRARNKIVFEKCLVKIPDAAPPTQNYNLGTGETAIIAIHYVLKLTALPGIECEVPIIVTTRGYKDKAKQAAFLIHNNNKQRLQAQHRAQNMVDNNSL